MMGAKASLVAREEALPGRASKMPVAKNHYVLKTPMEGPWPEHMKVFVFANGCFWGSEKGAWRLPGGGIHSTAVGYAGGFTPNPTYREACSGRTGHTEAVQVVYDPAKISLADILRWFWESHDPSQAMGQGNDQGSQYRSGLYYFDEEQKALCETSKAAYEAALQKAGRGRGETIATEIRAASDFSADGGQVRAKIFRANVARQHQPERLCAGRRCSTTGRTSTSSTSPSRGRGPTAPPSRSRSPSLPSPPGRPPSYTPSTVRRSSPTPLLSPLRHPDEPGSRQPSAALTRVSVWGWLQSRSCRRRSGSSTRPRLTASSRRPPRR